MLAFLRESLRMCPHRFTCQQFGSFECHIQAELFDVNRLVNADMVWRRQFDRCF